MDFPIGVKSQLATANIPGVKEYEISVFSGVTTFIGPNGSGKTQILRGFKRGLRKIIQRKKIRLMSAGRIGSIENHRSDFDGHRGDNILYDTATFGSKSDVLRRHNYETIMGDFQTLSARTDILIKVQERLRKLFNRDLFLEWDGGSLKAMFSSLEGDGHTYSSAREASGLLQLVAILSALYDNEVGALLIDEPEVSLHPQLQSFLLREIHRNAGDPDIEGKKLIFLATHSTEMIDLKYPSDLPSFVFCYDIKSSPIQISPDAGELKNEKIKSLLGRLGQEHKLALFCQRPLLLEGPTDSIICTGIDRRLDLFIEATGSQILPVIGTGQIPVVTKLMRLLGKEPVVLADADSFTDGLDLVFSFTTTEVANKFAMQQGLPDANSFARAVHSDFCQIVERDWVSIESLAKVHPYWLNGDKDNELEKVKRRAAFSTLMGLTEHQLNELLNSSEWKGIRTRIAALLSLLEKIGCFILRRGAIESYYMFSDPLTSEEKLSAAVDEVSGILNSAPGLVITQYNDIVRCLQFAARCEPINEAEAIRDLVLAIAAPALASLNSSTTDAKLRIMSQTILGERHQLFRLEVEKDEKGIVGLKIGLESKILELDCFPISISIGENPVNAVNNRLGLQSV